MLLKERIKEKESILEFVFLLKVDFNCNVTSLAQYPITGVSTSLSLMSSNNRVEYSAGCTLFSYLRNILYVLTLDLFHISYLSCSKASFGFVATKSNIFHCWKDMGMLRTASVLFLKVAVLFCCQGTRKNTFLCNVQT